MIKLPAEVYQNIFSYLKGKELSECLLVCKSWHPYANQQYWKNVAIHSIGIDNLKQLLCEDGCETYFKHGHLTQKMAFQVNRAYTSNCFGRNSEGKMFGVEEIIHLMSYFPNVEEIVVAERYYERYLRLLLNAELKNIKMIKSSPSIEPFEFDIYDLYVAFCLKHSDTITSLNFDYTESSGIKNNQLVDLSTLSSPFKNVTELVFRNCLDKDLTFMQVQEAFPNLIVLYFASIFRPDDDVVQKQIERIGDSAKNFNRNLKTLEILADIPTSYVKYLTKYLPNQLEKITLNITDTCLHLWLNDVGEENALKLMERLNGAKDASIFFEDEKERDSTAPTNISKITSHFKVANALIGNKKTYFTFKLANKYLINNRFTYNSIKGLELEYGYDHRADFSEKNEDTIEFNLPDKTTATIGSKTINCIEFSYNSMFNRHLDLPCAVTKYVFASYPKLERFTLNDSSSPYSEVIADSLKTEGRKTSRSTGENLKVIQLVNIAKHRKMLNMLATYLPSIESIRCVFNDHNSSYDDMNFNLNRFDNLTRFYFCVGVADRMDSRYLNIDIYFGNNQKKTYSYDVKIKKMTANFSSAADENAETITFTFNPRARLELYDHKVGTVAAFNNGELLNLDYPIETDFY